MSQTAKRRGKGQGRQSVDEGIQSAQADRPASALELTTGDVASEPATGISGDGKQAATSSKGNNKNDSKAGASQKGSDKTSDKPVIGSSVHSELAEGETYEGEKFLVPKTADTLEAFIHPDHISFITIIPMCLFVFWAYLYWYVQVPFYVNLIHFFITRNLYNAGLGYLLDIQSKYKRLTKWYVDISKKPNTLAAKFLRRCTCANLPKGKNPEDFPAAFNAWCVFKGLVNFVLVSDSTAYFFLCSRCFTLPDSITPLVIGQYLLGILLFIFFWWAKVDAHRCIGTYCWYWGDFFYRKNVELTFDGIFELFPHPMYTVGYAIYYANALFCRSYTVLIVSLAAHMYQLIFLVLVEEPHIKRTYGGEPNEAQRREARYALYDAEKGWFPSRSDLMYFLSFDLFNSGSWTLLTGCIYAFLVAYLPESPNWAVAQVVVWRVIHWIGLGGVLWQQSTRQVWTRHFMLKGRSLQEAFGHWKRIFNLSTTLNALTFAAAAIRLAPRDPAIWFTMEQAARVALGVVLLALSGWTAYSTYSSIGDFGWFYGDFFIPPDQYQNSLCYTGIYRFLNNPDAVTGYAGLYGIALITHSWTLFILALSSQLANMLFVNLVEVPHMKKLYDAENVRHEPPIEKRIKSIIPVDQVVNKELREDLRRVKTRALVEMYSIYRKLRNKDKDGTLTTTRMVEDHFKAGISVGKDGSKRATGVTPDACTSPSPLFGPNEDLYSATTTVVTSTSLPHPKTGVVTKLTVPKFVHVGDSLRVQYDLQGVKPDEPIVDTNWIGIYPIDTPSVPGVSDGRWMYVPPSASGEITLKPWLLPRQEGVYEVRFHPANTYDCVCSVPVVIVSQDAQSQDVIEQMNLSSPR